MYIEKPILQIGCYFFFSVGFLVVFFGLEATGALTVTFFRRRRLP
jgi:hypothetical protein